MLLCAILIGNMTCTISAHSSLSLLLFLLLRLSLSFDISNVLGHECIFLDLVPDTNTLYPVCLFR